MPGAYMNRVVKRIGGRAGKSGYEGGRKREGGRREGGRKETC